MIHYKFEALAIRLAGTRAACEYLAPVLTKRGSEMLAVAFCDDQSALLEMICFPGGAIAVDVPMVGILQTAVLIGAAGIVVGHNHPGGTAMPSDGDIRMTQRLVRSTEAVGVTLLDHLIYDGGPWFSFREHGLI